MTSCASNSAYTSSKSSPDVMMLSKIKLSTDLTYSDLILVVDEGLIGNLLSYYMNLNAKDLGDNSKSKYHGFALMAQRYKHL